MEDYMFKKSPLIKMPIQHNQISSMNSDITENITCNDGMQSSDKNIKRTPIELNHISKALRGPSNPKRVPPKRIKLHDRYVNTVCKVYNLRDVDIRYTQDDYQRIENFDQFCQKYGEVIKRGNPIRDNSFDINQHLMPAKWRQFRILGQKNSIEAYAISSDTSHKNETVSAGGSNGHGLGHLNKEWTKQLTKIGDEECEIVEELRKVNERRRILMDRLTELRHLRQGIIHNFMH